MPEATALTMPELEALADRGGVERRTVRSYGALSDDLGTDSRISSKAVPIGRLAARLDRAGEAVEVLDQDLVPVHRGHRPSEMGLMLAWGGRLRRCRAPGTRRRRCRRARAGPGCRRDSDAGSAGNDDRRGAA